MVKSIEIDLDVYRVIESARVDFDEPRNEILRRLLGISAASLSRGPLAKPRLPRSSGAYSTVVDKQVVEANSLKELLRRVILFCEKRRPGFVALLAAHPTPKGRYLVSRSREGLYPKAPQLTEYAEELSAGWWYDTNVGRNQVQSYFRTIASLARLPSLPQISKRSEKTTLTLADLELDFAAGRI